MFELPPTRQSPKGETTLSQMQKTSLEAYFKKVLPNLSRKQWEILQFFKHNPNTDFTNMEVAGHLGWSINRVTPRVLELRLLGHLVKAKRRVCLVTGNNAYSWQLRKEG